MLFGASKKEKEVIKMDWYFLNYLKDLKKGKNIFLLKKFLVCLKVTQVWR
jgi:hypothetical protein